MFEPADCLGTLNKDTAQVLRSPVLGRSPHVSTCILGYRILLAWLLRYWQFLSTFFADRYKYIPCPHWPVGSRTSFIFLLEISSFTHDAPYAHSHQKSTFGLNANFYVFDENKIWCYQLLVTTVKLSLVQARINFSVFNRKDRRSIDLYWSLEFVVLRRSNLALNVFIGGDNIARHFREFTTRS